MKKSSLKLAFAAAALLTAVSAMSLPEEWHVAYGHYPEFPPGFLVQPDQRFDPFVQRLMAERSLKALPIKGGQLFYIVPVTTDPHVEERQIRYLEWLLDQRSLEPSAAQP